jgi:hypothetical protein
VTASNKGFLFLQLYNKVPIGTNVIGTLSISSHQPKSITTITTATTTIIEHNNNNNNNFIMIKNKSKSYRVPVSNHDAGVDVVDGPHGVVVVADHDPRLREAALGQGQLRARRRSRKRRVELELQLFAIFLTKLSQAVLHDKTLIQNF